ncbi:MAG: hypothetical protein AAGA56_23135 [Myxococcota bacterium]
MAGIIALGALGCEETGQQTEIACGPAGEDFVDFAPVSLVLERRCGTLDCHGSFARPLRIYGAGGLRKVSGEQLEAPDQLRDEGLVSGGVGTTIAEFEANYRSLCGVEPEKTTEVILGERAPEDLLILRKPLLIERHKGSQLFLPGGAGANCLTCWLLGFPQNVACETARDDCAAAIQEQL